MWLGLGHWFSKKLGRKRKGAREIVLLTCAIHGSRYYEMKKLLDNEALFVGQIVKLRREPDNPYDTNAIAVWTKKHQQLGYVPKKHNTVIAALMDQNIAVNAYIESIITTAYEPASMVIYIDRAI